MNPRPMTLAERKALRQQDRDARYGIVTNRPSIPNTHRLIKAERRAWTRSGL